MNSSTTIQFEQGETVGKLLTDYYILAAEKIRVMDNEGIMFDCRKSNIAPNLNKTLYAAYRSKHWEEYHRDPKRWTIAATRRSFSSCISAAPTASR